MRRSASLCLILTTAIPAQNPQTDLQMMVRLPSPVERLKVADRLAKKSFPDLDGWLEAMTKFGEFSSVEPGTCRHEVSLWNGKTSEKTEVFVHVPTNYSQDQPAPLLLMGHGTESSGHNQDLRWHGPAKDLGMIVICPTESVDNSGYRFSERERQLARSAIRWARLRFNIDENRIYLSGISRGGHMCWDLALRYPDMAAAIAPMIGGPRLGIAQGQNNLRYIENITTLPIRDLQGQEDDPLLIANLELAFAELQKLGNQTARMIKHPLLGHAFEFGTVDWSVFLGASFRDPMPLRVVRVAARRGKGRAYWAEITGYTKDVREEFRLRVKAWEWNALSAAQQREKLHREAIGYSARLEINMVQPGHFEAQATGVRSYRLLLTDEMLDADGRVHLTEAGKTRISKPRRRRHVLMREFSERFDRQFLPTMQVRSR